MRVLLVLAALVPLGLMSGLMAGCPQPTCAADADCEGAEAFCVEDADSGSVCARGCAADLPCRAGQACVARDDGSFEGACLATTDSKSDGAGCTGDRQCASGACLGEAGNQVCVAVCEVGGDCPTGADLCTLEGLRHVCVPPLDSRAVGETCNSPRECLSGTCVVDPDAVGAQAVCVEACADNVPCATASAVCVRLAGGGRACLEPLDDGATCQASSACAGGFCVQDIDEKKKCASPCTADACAEGFGCQTAADGEGNDLCLPVLDTRSSGQACTSARECASGHCAHFATATEDLGTLCADPCPADQECGAGLVCWTDPGGTDVCGPTP